MIKYFLMISGMLILKIVYGKAYSEKASQKMALMFLLSMINGFWLLCLFFLAIGGASGDTAFCLILGVGYPVAITIWAVLTRKQLASKQETPIEDEPDDKNNHNSQ